MTKRVRGAVGSALSGLAPSLLHPPTASAATAAMAASSGRPGDSFACTVIAVPLPLGVAPPTSRRTADPVSAFPVGGPFLRRPCRAVDASPAATARTGRRATRSRSRVLKLSLRAERPDRTTRGLLAGAHHSSGLLAGDGVEGGPFRRGEPELGGGHVLREMVRVPGSGDGEDVRTLLRASTPAGPGAGVASCLRATASTASSGRRRAPASRPCAGDGEERDEGDVLFTAHPQALLVRCRGFEPHRRTGSVRRPHRCDCLRLGEMADPDVRHPEVPDHPLVAQLGQRAERSAIESEPAMLSPQVHHIEGGRDLDCRRFSSTRAPSSQLVRPGEAVLPSVPTFVAITRSSGYGASASRITSLARYPAR